MQKRDLNARLKEFSLTVIQLVTALPRSDAAKVLGNQVLRSGTSIGANYREASRARSKPEFISKTGDALREAGETEYWLELLLASGIAKAEGIDPIIQESRELIAILVTINKNAKNGG